MLEYIYCLCDKFSGHLFLFYIASTVLWLAALWIGKRLNSLALWRVFCVLGAIDLIFVIAPSLAALHAKTTFTYVPWGVGYLWIFSLFIGSIHIGLMAWTIHYTQTVKKK